MIAGVEVLATVWVAEHFSRRISSRCNGPGIKSVFQRLARFLLLYLEMASIEWKPLTKTNLARFTAGFAIFIILLFCSEPGFILILDHANLLFHEAGHPIIGLFSSRLEPYGGTIGQLVFPVVLVVDSLRKGQSIGVAASCIWFFENCLNIARYLADARAMELPLVGGGDHDWNTILSHWGLLHYDTQIAGAIRTLAWVGIFSSCAWLIWHAVRDRNRTSSNSLM